MNSSVILFRNVVLGHHCEKIQFSVLVTPKSQVTSKMHYVAKELTGKYGAPFLPKFNVPFYIIHLISDPKGNI